ncbi:hypothetical protein MRB53_040570 [Persea americana]|nr:hypothetical protein MRB53_040570 [Persea americana]
MSIPQEPNERSALLSSNAAQDNGTVERTAGTPADPNAAETLPVDAPELSTKEVLLAFYSRGNVDCANLGRVQLLEIAAWLAIAYLIANAALQPLSGRFTDIFGRAERVHLWPSRCRHRWRLSVCDFRRDSLGFSPSSTTWACGKASETSWLVLEPVFPPRLSEVSVLTRSGLGGVFGGFMHDVWNWRGAFWVQLPFIAVAGVLSAFTIKLPVRETDKSKLKRVDYLGAILLVSFIVLLLLGLNSGGNIVPWNHPLVYITIPISAVLAVAWVYVEDKVAAEPIIPPRLLLNRTIAASSVLTWLMAGAYLSYYYYLPLFLQVKGLSTTAAGARLIPSPVGVAVGSVTSGLIMRATGKYLYLNLLYQAFWIAGLVMMWTLLDFQSPGWLLVIILFLTGLGLGGIATVYAPRRTKSKVLTDFCQLIPGAHLVCRPERLSSRHGLVLHVQSYCAIYQNVLKDQLWYKLGDVENADYIIHRIRDNLAEIQALPADLRDLAKSAYLVTFKDVFLAIFVMGALSTFSSFFMKENVLHNNMGRK